MCLHVRVGKGWAKGLTAATDPRIARMAEARRGKSRGRYRVRRSPEWIWTPELAYAVGLIATDGNLSPSGRHVSVSSAERVVLETFLRCIGRSAKIGQVKGGYGDHGLRVQIGDVGLYRWLQSIGLTPRKSLTLGSITIPDALFPHLLRGLVDGDGSIIDCTYDGTGKALGGRYRTLLVRFNTASREHAEWIRDRIRKKYGLAGGLWCQDGMFQLTYAKRASRRLLPLLYPSPDVPCIPRKRDVWQEFEREAAGAVALN
jgi:hypothetical protein